MKTDFPVEKTVKARSSIRTYEERQLPDKVKNQINTYISSLSNPFSIDVKFRLIETDTAANNAKLGTYGMIKGTKYFIGATVAEGNLALEALGYSMEKLILYAASIGLGTCWLGGTFNRSEFAKAMEVKDNELFPAISPIGYPFGKRRLKESMVRKFAQSDKRKDWKELFFNLDFSQPLNPKDAGKYEFALEMLRLAPSAANKQPWRIVKTEKGLHFYEAKTLGGNHGGIDIQRVDLGIAACHFHLAAIEKGLTGSFVKNAKPDIQIPHNMDYIFSWII